MNLISLYDSLSLPVSGNGIIFNAIPIPDFSSFRMAVDIEGNPVLLLSVVKVVKDVTVRNFKLKYISLQQDVECKVTDAGKISFETFTVITFTGEDRSLQEYFFRVSETFIKGLGNKPTQRQAIDSLNRFIELFRSLGDIPSNTVQGLWAELFLIESSRGLKSLLNYWHNLPEEKFDFNSGTEKIEVKSSSRLERVHTFSSEQLSPQPESRILIASIFLKQHSEGISIQQLSENITTKISGDLTLIEKLTAIIFKTLGNSLEQAIKIKFDYNLAKNSLRFYRQEDISSICEAHIPSEVSDVSYKSDLTNINPIDEAVLKTGGDLFNSILEEWHTS